MPNYEVVQLDDIPSVSCPCGETRRDFVSSENPVATLHMVDITHNSKVHYHKKLTMAATRPGVPAAEVLRKGIEAYRAKGYPEEWKLHHQGGSIGYSGRDYRCHFQTPDIVQENQAFTWNPSLTGTKSEDTIVAATGGVEMITLPIRYPTLSVEAGDHLREAGYP